MNDITSLVSVFAINGSDAHLSELISGLISHHVLKILITNKRAGDTVLPRGTLPMANSIDVVIWFCLFCINGAYQFLLRRKLAKIF